MNDFRIIAHWVITEYIHWDAHPITEPLIPAPSVTPETLAGWRWN